MRRRAFIGNASLGTISLLGLPNSLFGKGSRLNADAKDRVVEWNVHFFSSDTMNYPFHEKATYTPDASRLSKDPLKDYLQYLDSQGIGRGVVVQPEPYGDDHSLLVDCLARVKGKLKGTSLFYPKDPKAPAKLETLVKAHPEIVATRFHAHRGKEVYLDSFKDPGVFALWKKAADLDIVIELHIGPDYASQVYDTIQSFPGCKVLIDHFAEPHMGTGVEFADVLQLATLPNVYMKFSGLGHFAEDGPDFLSARNFTRLVLHAYGPDRMVMGGLPLSTIRKHMAHYSEDDIAKVTGKNILKLLEWE